MIDPVTGMAVASTVFSALGKIGQGRAQKKAAKRSQRALEFEAEQLEQIGGQEFAISQRRAEGERRKSDVLIRQLMAHFSAGGPVSAGQLTLLARMEAQKAYNISSIIASGKSREALRKSEAAVKRYRGELGVGDAQSAQGASRLAAGADLFAGGATLYSRYKST